MDCNGAQDLALDEIDGRLEPSQRPELLRHLAGCEACREFANLQRRLDAELRTSLATPPLDGHFRPALGRRLRGEPWPDWLPDLAYLLGAALATAATVLALPLPAASTWWIGAVLAGAGLVVHSVLARAFSDLEAVDGP